MASLAAAVESVRSMRPQPDAVLISGDLADNATDAEYEQVHELLAPLRAPVYVLLATAPEVPTLLAMHHPPLVTGVPAWDELGLPGRGLYMPRRTAVGYPREPRLVVYATASASSWPT